MMRVLPAVLLCVLLASPSLARDKEAFFDVPLETVKITEGSLPHFAPPWKYRAVATPRVLLDGPGEAWLIRPVDDGTWYPDDVVGTHLYVRLPSPGDAVGRLVLPGWDDREVRVVRFRIPAAAAKAKARDAVLSAGERHFQTLAGKDPGVPLLPGPLSPGDR